MRKLIATTALIALMTTGLAGLAQAQTAPVPAPTPAPTSTPTTPAVSDPGHPRINEVDQRLQNQQNRIDAGVAKGQINAKQEMRDEKTDTRVSQELSKDEAKNGGHITKAEQTKINRQLNKNSTRIHRQRTQKSAAPVAPVSGQ